MNPKSPGRIYRPGKWEVSRLFTVVIAEQKYLDDIQKYQIFLKPFTDAEHVTFCCWKTDKTQLDESAPELVEVVARHENWRAVVVCGDGGIGRKNPFDSAPYRPAERAPDEDESAYLSHVLAGKSAAYAEAAKQPLTKLMTFLCADPMVSSDCGAASQDPEFAEYLAEAREKQRLRDDIRKGKHLDIVLPSEILCIAPRNCKESEYDIKTPWTPHVEHEYSRFCDWNLYYDKMRYLVFDVLPAEHRNYEFDHIRFLYALMVLASNPIPDGCLQPGRVYCLDCENDEQALSRFLQRYDNKLKATEAWIQNQTQDLECREKKHLSDREAETAFCTKITVPVTVPAEFEMDPLYLPRNHLGLSADCPADEKSILEEAYQQSARTMTRYLKQPQRALRRAAEDARNLSKPDLDQASLLNEYQTEDIEDYIRDEELTMVSLKTINLTDGRHCSEEMSKANARIQNKAETRMTKKTTVGLGIFAIGIFALCFLPLFISNFADTRSRLFSALMTVGATLVLAAAGFVCLLCFRAALKKEVEHYNGVVGGLIGEIGDAMLQFSRYLSHVCNVMHGFAIVNFKKENPEPDSIQARILEKHENDIRKERANLHETFGSFLSASRSAEAAAPEIYEYDFCRPVDYSYPMPYSESQKRQVEFLQTGNQVLLPVDFVKRITVRREELYD
jgi:hypothetical protein